MKKNYSKTAALLLTLVLASLFVPSLALADDAEACYPEKPPEQYREGGMSMPVSSSHDDSRSPLTANATLPALFRLDDSRLTPVRNQDPYGTCWAHSAIGSAESILESNNLANNPDFSEWQLAYIAFTSVDGQPAYYLSSGETPYNVGGNDCNAAAMFTRGVSPVWEYQIPYNSGTPSQVFASDFTLKNWSIAHKVYDTQVNTEWKTMLMEKGALSVSYFHNPAYCYEGTTTNYYNPVFSYTNHAVTLVGWDDNYPASNFRNSPPGNGAWIIKNSWGASWGDDGYFYISYYDKTLNANASAFELMPRIENEKMYTHDELGWLLNLSYADSEIIYTKSVFTAASTEKLTTIGFYTKSDNTDYTIQIRTANPSGEFVNAWSAPQAGTVAASGYTRIDLLSPVSLSAGQQYEVIVSYADPGTGTFLPVEFTPSSRYAPGQSFYSTDSTNWTDLYNYFPLGPCDTCIFAFTLPDSAPAHTVMFLAQGGSEVDPVSTTTGSLLSEPVSPKRPGYTFDGWHKDPACTDKWDFANDKMPDTDLSLYAKWKINQYTIIFDGQGGSIVAPVSANYGALIQAPAASVKEGHRFLGWYKEPACVTPWNFNTDTIPAGNVTLYAGWTPSLKLTSSVSSGNIGVGKSITLTPNVSGGSWSFDSTYLSRIDSTFTGLKAGTTRVTYTAEGQSVFIDVTVSQVPVELSCTKTDATVYGAAGGSITVTASGGNSGRYEYAVNGAPWQSANVLGGLTAGTYTVAARDAANTSNTASCSVSIGQPPHLGSIPAKKISAKANAGTAFTVSPPAAPKGYIVTSVTYTSSNPSFATVDESGNVTFLAGGKATITTKVVSQTTDRKGRVRTNTTTVKKTITVQQPVAAISLNLGDATVARAEKVKLAASFHPVTASNKKVKWTSSNPKVASVSSSGVVTGKAGGTAVITCTAKDGSGAFASCTVTVTPIFPAGVKISKAALTVKTGKTASLKATVLPKTTDLKTVTWTSSRPDVAAVDAKGRVKGIAPGSAVITATTSNGLTVSCTVIVN